ncbi:hypothetical protein CRUP_021421 [Coryphaenoides rupestris]|nr:hypothetical protein CRUP_021421 [Coryphaenoides rupestris]
MERDSHSEDSLFSTLVLENIKNQLVQAFRATGSGRNHRHHRHQHQQQQDHDHPCCCCCCCCTPIGCLSGVGGSQQANEELRRAKVDGAITWLRSELLEMRSHDQHLAQTLLGLNSEIQRMRRESYGALEVEVEVEGEAEDEDQP